MAPRQPNIQPQSASLSPRERIVKHARSHFFAHGFRSVTMDDLAADLGMSKKTLYAHFTGKVALLEAVIIHKFCEIDAGLAQINSDKLRSFPEALQKLVAHLMNQLDEPRPPFLKDLQKEPWLFERMEELRREVIRRRFEKLLVEGRRSGMLRKDVPPRVVIEIILGVIGSIINPSKISELRLTPQAAFAMVMTVVFRGILAEKGRGAA